MITLPAFRRLPALSALPLLILLAGCFSTSAPQPKYTVADLPEQPMPELATLRVRLAPDLRSLSTPIQFNEDGTVVPVRGITYYAPLELAIERLLREAAGPQTTELARGKMLTLTFFGVDARGGEAQAVVAFTLEGKPIVSRRIARPLPPDCTPAQLRKLLGDLLLELCKEAFQPAEPPAA